MNYIRILLVFLGPNHPTLRKYCNTSKYPLRGYFLALRWSLTKVFRYFTLRTYGHLDRETCQLKYYFRYRLKFSKNFHTMESLFMVWKLRKCWKRNGQKINNHLKRLIYRMVNLAEMKRKTKERNDKYVSISIHLSTSISIHLSTYLLTVSEFYEVCFCV